MKAIIEATSYTETDPEASKLMEEEVMIAIEIMMMMMSGRKNESR
jgi:hypothetical protein